MCSQGVRDLLSIYQKRANDIVWSQPLLNKALVHAVRQPSAAAAEHAPVDHPPEVAVGEVAPRSQSHDIEAID